MDHQLEQALRRLQTNPDDEPVRVQALLTLIRSERFEDAREVIEPVESALTKSFGDNVVARQTETAMGSKGDYSFLGSKARFVLEVSAQTPTTNVTECEMAVPWTAIDSVVSGASTIHLLFVNDDVSDFAPDASHIVLTATR